MQILLCFFYSLKTRTTLDWSINYSNCSTPHREKTRKPKRMNPQALKGPPKKSMPHATHAIDIGICDVMSALRRIGAHTAPSPLRREESPSRLDGRTQSNRRLWRRLARAAEAVLGRPLAGPQPGRAELPKTARHALKRHRGRTRNEG